MKKSLFYLSVLGLLMVYFNAAAQDVSIGVRGGISIPNLTAGGSEQNPLNTGYSSRQGPDFGLYGEFRISELFSIEPMLEYSSQGGKKDGLQAVPGEQFSEYFEETHQSTPTYVYANYNSEAKLNYLMVPVLAKFGWALGKASPWRFYADAGPFAGFLLNAHQVTSGTSEVYSDPAGTQAEPGLPAQNFGGSNGNTDIKPQLHTFDLGIEGNLGFSYKIKRSSIFIEGGGNYGFLNIQKGTANGKNNTGAATADIGYALGFGK
jgi:hypothetical protein